MNKIISLMSFVDSYKVADNEKLFSTELNWIISKVRQTPARALFISYAYNDNNPNDYFKEVSDIVARTGISQVTDITSAANGTAVDLISGADLFIVGGGDILMLKRSLDLLTDKNFNPYRTIRKMVENGIPYIAWNEGSEIISNVYFKPPDQIVDIGLGLSKNQVICNYSDNSANNTGIEDFLLDHPVVEKVICIVNKPQTKPVVRLEEVGGGLIDSTPDNSTSLVVYTPSN